MLTVIDYGVGNLANVERALRRAGARDVVVTSDARTILGSRTVVLPGVGHFGHCARELASRGLDATVRAARERGIPILGLCVGMQLLFERSEEDASARGLGLLAGSVRRLVGSTRVPHTGWNEVRLERPHPWLAGLPNRAYYYFVHSYAPRSEGEATIATTEHGATFASIVGDDGLLGVQFHPEKSSLAGTRLLQSVMRAIS